MKRRIIKLLNHTKQSSYKKLGKSCKDICRPFTHVENQYEVTITSGASANND